MRRRRTGGAVNIVIISLAAFAASALTLYSGFGLGTLLMPVVAIFFPLDIAIALTAIVHLANNLFKLALLGKHADRSVLWRFGVPALLFAFVGALVLGWLADLPPILTYSALGGNWEVAPIKLAVGLLILAFVALELSPAATAVAIDRKYLPLGGAISGFFGGLSGHQGAFRSMFLLKAGLSKEAFIATGVVIAVLVDCSRMTIYAWRIFAMRDDIEWPLVIAASLSAFVGAYLGAKLLKKLTLRAIQVVVSLLLVVVSLGLITGLL
jgi:uncharacterized protein